MRPRNQPHTPARVRIRNPAGPAPGAPRMRLLPPGRSRVSVNAGKQRMAPPSARPRVILEPHVDLGLGS
jgi:hypothetical protein